MKNYWFFCSLLFLFSCERSGSVAITPKGEVLATSRVSGETIEQPKLGLSKGDTSAQAERMEPTQKNGTGDWFEPYSHYYGVYLNGSKTGWMQVTGKENHGVIEFSTLMEAKIGGMGRVSQVNLSEKRAYSGSGNLLTRLHFVQSSSTGKVEVNGFRDTGKFKLEILAGGNKVERFMEVWEKVSDILDVQSLVKTGKVGDSIEVSHFDASSQKEFVVQHRVLAMEQKLFGGIETSTLKIETNYPAMQIKETSWYDRSGKLLEAKVGGFFVARLEPEEEAKRLDYIQDLLVSSVVKPPSPLTGIEQRTSMKLTMGGFGKLLPPESPRQKVKSHGDTLSVELQVDDALPVIKLPIQGGPQTALEATPFIQSNHPNLISKAEAVTSKAATLPTAVELLVRFVYSHVQDEYVPAFSNALEALESGKGDCTEHSILFVAMARAIGIPARMAVGVAYWPPGQGFGWHAWAEVWANGQWYAVDPTWNQVNADVSHIKLAEGAPYQQARIVMLLGKLSIENAE